MVAADVADDQQVQHMVERTVERTVERFGAVDALFADAGFGHLHRGEQDLGDLERRMWEVNYQGTRRAIQAVVAHLRSRGGGHVLLCSSVVGVTGLPYASTSAATKAAQMGLFASLGPELEPAGIKMSCVYPGHISGPCHEGVSRAGGRAVRA